MNTLRRWILIASGALLATLLLAWWSEARRLEPVVLLPVLSGEEEYCLTCHAQLKEISPSHPVETFGCVLCHGGERLALDADLAHSSLRGGGNPSDLTVAEQSCGGSQCHSGSETDQRNHLQRVETSVQTTYAGAIASIRYSFGAQEQPAAVYGITAVTDDRITTSTGLTSLAAFDAAAETNPAVRAFADNCLTCHINAQPRAGDPYRRLTGCAACHSPLTPTPLPAGEGAEGGERGIHTLTTAISYKQCNTCHNRGNYDLREMTFIERDDQPVGRAQDYYQPIAQFTQCEYTLDCIDCHTRIGAMGDGDIHSSKHDIQYVQCKTCHGTPDGLPLTRTLRDENDLAFRLAALNPVLDLKLGDTILVTELGEPLWNTRRLPDGTYEMTGKATNQRFVFRPVQGSGCTQDPADQSSAACHECHAVQR